MRKFIFVSMIALTAAGAVSAPSFAQQHGGGGKSAGNGSTGDYYEGLSRSNNRRPIYIINGKSTAYCSTNWAVLHDEYGNRTWVRHCEDRRDIEVD